jgi:hypothetical protein
MSVSKHKYHTKGYKIDIRAYREDGTKKTPDEVYADIKANSPDNLLLAVDMYLSQRPGVNVTKEQICMDLYGEYTDSLDRNVRDAVADLVTYLERPYITTSHEEGYKNCMDVIDLDPGIADLEKRINTSKLRLEGLKASRVRLLEGKQRIPVQIPTSIMSETSGLLW